MRQTDQISDFVDSEIFYRYGCYIFLLINARNLNGLIPLLTRHRMRRDSQINWHSIHLQARLVLDVAKRLLNANGEVRVGGNDWLEGPPEAFFKHVALQATDTYFCVCRAALKKIDELFSYSDIKKSRANQSLSQNDNEFSVGLVYQYLDVTRYDDDNQP